MLQTVSAIEVHPECMIAFRKLIAELKLIAKRAHKLRNDFLLNTFETANTSDTALFF
jgi:hypothetical protein